MHSGNCVFESAGTLETYKAEILIWWNLPGHNVSVEICKWQALWDFPACASNCNEFVWQSQIPPFPPSRLCISVLHLSDSILCFCSTCSQLDSPAVRVWHVFNKSPEGLKTGRIHSQRCSASCVLCVHFHTRTQVLFWISWKAGVVCKIPGNLKFKSPATMKSLNSAGGLLSPCWIPVNLSSPSNNTAGGLVKKKKKKKIPYPDSSVIPP